jgi:hypothetical protein
MLSIDNAQRMIASALASRNISDLVTSSKASGNTVYSLTSKGQEIAASMHAVINRFFADTAITP